MPAKLPVKRKAKSPKRKTAAAAAQPSTSDRRGLAIFLKQVTDFRLALALYNDALERDAVIRSLADELAPAGVRVLTLDLREESSERTLLGRVEALIKGAAAAEGKRVAVMAVNLESCVDYTPELSGPGGPGTAFLETANLHRELFQKACPCPLVIWMTELLERAFVRYAPDLWHWRSHVFDLRTRRQSGKAGAAVEHQELPSYDFRLHPSDRLRRLEEELAGYRKAGARLEEARALNSIGMARIDSGDARLARQDFEAALSIFQELGDRRGEGNGLGNLGLAYAGLGDVRKALEFHAKQLVIAREIGDRRGEGAALGNLGIVYGNLGDARKAIEFHEKQLLIFREIGDRRVEGYALNNLGIAHANLGDVRKAIDFYKKRLVIARETGDRRGEGSGLGNLGLAYAKLGDLRKAIEFYEKQLVIARESGNRRGEGAALGNLGSAYANLGDARKAIEFHEKQLVIAREISDRRAEGNGLWNSALSLVKLANQKEAVARAEGALQIFEAIEDPHAAKVRVQLAEWRGK